MADSRARATRRRGQRGRCVAASPPRARRLGAADRGGVAPDGVPGPRGPSAARGRAAAARPSAAEVLGSTTIKQPEVDDRRPLLAARVRERPSCCTRRTVAGAPRVFLQAPDVGPGRLPPGRRAGRDRRHRAVRAGRRRAGPARPAARTR